MNIYTNIDITINECIWKLDLIADYKLCVVAYHE